MDWDRGKGRRMEPNLPGFQFPSRNSMDWDQAVRLMRAFKYLRVSIPQSEFDGLGLLGDGLSWGLLGCFNSPVGIRWIGTWIFQTVDLGLGYVSIPQSEFDGLGLTCCCSSGVWSRKFQFPSRNSMDWDNESPGASWADLGEFQFPSRNSIRRKPQGLHRDAVTWGSFNSPVGIRWIGTSSESPSAPRKARFQFPSRNSMDWDRMYLDGVVPEWFPVSIPQSEFDGLGPRGDET